VLSGAVEFQFPLTYTLAAGAVIVVVGDTKGFVSSYTRTIMCIIMKLNSLPPSFPLPPPSALSCDLHTRKINTQEKEYGEDITIAGQFSKSLSKKGETLNGFGGAFTYASYSLHSITQLTQHHTAPHSITQRHTALHSIT
jgi:hypothetical protein